jgi:hypothetical protein
MDGKNKIEDKTDVTNTNGKSSRKRSRKHSRTEKDCSDDDEQHHHVRKHSKSDEQKKSNKKSKHRKRHDYDSNNEESSSKSSNYSSNTSDESSQDHRDRKKRHKKEHKKKKIKKRHKKDKSDTKHRHKNDRNDDMKPVDNLERNHSLADALCSLFNHHPNFASELPIILIRLGRGTTMDLSAMTDQDAAQRLTTVFHSLSSFGVTLADDGKTWSWNNPAVSRTSSTNNNNDLVLIRVVRALLDQIGLTMNSIEQYENPPLIHTDSLALPSKNSSGDEGGGNEVERKVIQMLQNFTDGNVAAELVSICTMLIDGEMINLDGIPDEAVKESLESLLIACGLEKSEMDVDDSDDDENINADPTMGFGLPEIQADHVKSMLTSVINICHSKPKASTRRPIKGPMLPDSYNDTYSSDDDDEGPLPFGASDAIRNNILSKEQVKASAARRAYEMACAKEGVDIDPALLMNSVREEWMVVPGKYDFLSSVQTGRSRTFASKVKGVDHQQNESIDPKIQAEIRSIREAYEETRGPSLMDQHREAKMLLQQQKQREANANMNESWKWNRDKDLDAGRRVDTEALGMILGNASTDLKNKFQSGI